MTCARCHGLLLPTDLVEDGARVPAACCVNCGDVLDPVIVANRLRPPEPPRRHPPSHHALT